MRGGVGVMGDPSSPSPPPLDISPEPPPIPLAPPEAALPTAAAQAGYHKPDGSDSPPPLMWEAEEDVKPPAPQGRDAEGTPHEQTPQGFVPYGLQARRDLVDQQSSGYHVRPHEKATLGLVTTYRYVGERQGKVRPRGGWAGTATGETRLFTSDDGTLRLGPHLPLLLGRYRFLRAIGEGTFAQIVCAEDTMHPARRQVAIKILNFHYGEVGKREALCLRVAHEASAEGQHAAIVRLLGVFDFMGHFCLVLELCQGGSLQAFIKPLVAPAPASSPAAIAAMPTVPTQTEAGEGMPLPQLREVALHLVKALLLLHNHDVIHADLKPENVLLLAPPPRQRSGSFSGGNGVPPRPRSASFSIGMSIGLGGIGSGGLSSSSTGGGGHAGAWSGLGASVRLTDLGNAIKSREVKLYKEDFEIQTLGYRAPEVLLGGCGGQAFDHRIDMWSLGVLLVELHLGRPLFRAASKMLMVKRILSVLGPLPARAFVTGKFYAALFGADHRLRPEALALKDDATHAATALVDPATVQNSFRYDAGAHHRLVCDLLRTRDRDLIGFIAGLLQLDPAARLTSLQALMHPFLAPCFPFSLLRPHLAPAVNDGLREQQRRQQQGDEQAKPVIRPGRLFVEAGATEAVGVKREERAAAPTTTSTAAALAGMPDSDGPQPSPGSTPALSLGPESLARASDGEDDEPQEAQEAEVGEQEEGRGATRKRLRDVRHPRDRKPPAPAPAPAAAAAASSPAKASPGKPTKPKPTGAASARKWWEEGEEEDEDEEAETEGGGARGASRSRAVRQRPFAEEKAGGRDEELRPPAQEQVGPVVVQKRSSLEAAAVDNDDDISEDELIL